MEINVGAFYIILGAAFCVGGFIGYALGHAVGYSRCEDELSDIQKLRARLEREDKLRGKVDRDGK